MIPIPQAIICPFKNEDSYGEKLHNQLTFKLIKTFGDVSPFNILQISHFCDWHNAVMQSVTRCR